MNTFYNTIKNHLMNLHPPPTRFINSFELLETYSNAGVIILLDGTALAYHAQRLRFDSGHPRYTHLNILRL